MNSSMRSTRDMIIFLFCGLITMVVFGFMIESHIESHENKTTDYCQGLDMSNLEADYYKYRELTNQADMMEKRAKNLYKTGHITSSQLRTAKDNRYNISKQWLKIHDCLGQLVFF